VLRERYAEITAMDRAIGKLRGYLRDEGLRGNTIVWYCGDNGIPQEARATTPFRGQKGQVYEGGVRVAGILEWPARVKQPKASDLHAVTSDMLPTLCAAAGAPLPDRPLDGVSLLPLIEGEMAERPEPICFWTFNTRRLTRANLEPYIAPELQQGTTPLAKLMDGVATRSFQNFRHPPITEEDFGGARAILDNRYKLVLDAAKDGPELFDIRADRTEEKDLAAASPDIAKDLADRMRAWQESVLASLSGKDYS
jgi:arylsulfatase A-like enzyme